MKCTNINDVYHYLDDIPTEVNKVYDIAWQRATDKADPLKSKRAKTILMWVCLAKRPLGVKALGEVIQVSEGDRPGTKLLTGDDIVSTCAGFVRTFGRTDCPPGLTVTLSHTSAQEYMDGNAKQYFPRSHDTIVDTCLAARFDPDILYTALSLENLTYVPLFPRVSSLLEF